MLMEQTPRQDPVRKKKKRSPWFRSETQTTALASTYNQVMFKATQGVFLSTPSSAQPKVKPQQQSVPLPRRPTLGMFSQIKGWHQTPSCFLQREWVRKINKLLNSSCMLLHPEEEELLFGILWCNRDLPQARCSLRVYRKKRTVERRQFIKDVVLGCAYLRALESSNISNADKQRAFLLFTIWLRLLFKAACYRSFF